MGLHEELDPSRNQESGAQPTEPPRQPMLTWTWSRSSLSPCCLSSSCSQPPNPTKVSFLLPPSLLPFHPPPSLLLFMPFSVPHLRCNIKCPWRVFRSSYPFLPHPIISHPSLSDSVIGLSHPPVVVYFSSPTPIQLPPQLPVCHLPAHDLPKVPCRLQERFLSSAHLNLLTQSLIFSAPAIYIHVLELSFPFPAKLFHLPTSSSSSHLV